MLDITSEMTYSMAKSREYSSENTRLERVNETSSSSSPLRILLIDDDPDIAFLLSKKLLFFGYIVEIILSGEKAIEWLRTNTTDLIFLDVSMPGMSGLDVLAYIRKQNYDSAVIMTTAFSSEQTIIEALRLGADDYMRKPTDFGELKAILERTITRLMLHRKNILLQQQLDEKCNQLQTDIARAADVQASLLPKSFPHIPGFDIAAECVPALEIGGDFYDWEEPEPGVLALRLCDVMGKGIPAALLMATVRAVMRSVVHDRTPAEAIERVNQVLEHDLNHADSFATLFMAHLDSRTRLLTFVDAGHGHAFVRRASGSVVLLKPRGLPIGVLSDSSYVEGAIVLDPGDALVIYSDGLIDARPDLELNHQSIANHLSGTDSALAMIDRLVALLAPLGIPPDDVTLVVVLCK